MTKIQVSIIITYYSDKKKLFDTIESVLQNKPQYAELLVIDNSESDTLNQLKTNNDIVYIKSAKNGGYGAGNNLGAANASGEYLFFLNPDTRINKKTIPHLVRFFKNNKQAGIVAPNLVDPKENLFPQLGSNELDPVSGMIALSFVNTVFPENPISRNYWLADQDMGKDREVKVVPGSAFMIKKSIFNKIHGFDEKFFLFFEESDICKRVREMGYKVFFAANSEVVHIWKFDNREEPLFLKKHFVHSRFYYFKKHYGVFWAIIVEIFTRMSRILALFF